ncbi:hypothetical protein C8R43DRAFT_680714 [Mycena crocata]|nr:hypothetical protein C8R43DRAFT_680714 [Mycena crocata]
MKFTLKSPVFKKSTPRSTPATGLKSLVLVERLQVTPPAVIKKKKNANPAVRVLRRLGLKKSERNVAIVKPPFISVAINTSFRRSSPAKMLPRDALVGPVRPQVTASAGPLSPSRPCAIMQPPSHTHALVPHTVLSVPCKMVASPPHLSSRRAISGYRLSVIRERTGTPVKRVVSLPRTVSGPLHRARLVSPPSLSNTVAPTLRPLWMSDKVAASNSPALPAPTATAPKAPSFRQHSRIPRYVRRRSALTANSEGHASCVLCGCTFLQHPTSEAWIQTSVSDIPVSVLDASSPTFEDCSGTPADEFCLGLEQDIVKPQFVEMAVQTELEEFEMPAAFSDRRDTPSVDPPRSRSSPRVDLQAVRTLLAGIKDRRAKALSADSSHLTDNDTKPTPSPAAPWIRTTSDFLDELRDRLARPKMQAPTPAISPPAPSCASPPTKPKASAPAPTKSKVRDPLALHHRRRENGNGEEEEGELLQLFRRRRSGANGISRTPLGVLDMNTAGSSRQEVSGPAPRKFGRIVVPPVTEGSLPSRDPRILSELDRLRAQGKVAGAGKGKGKVDGGMDGGRQIGTTKENPERENPKMYS